MALSVRVRQIKRVGGRIYIIYGHKTCVDFANRQEVLEWCRAAFDQPDSEAIRFLEKLIIAKWLHDDPTGVNQALIEGKTVTLDLSTPALVSIA